MAQSLAGIGQQAVPKFNPEQRQTHELNRMRALTLSLRTFSYLMQWAEEAEIKVEAGNRTMKDGSLGYCYSPLSPPHTRHLYMWKEGSSLLLVSPTEQNPLESSMCIWSSSRFMFLRILLEAEWGQGGACLRGEPKAWVGSGLPHSDRATLPLTLSYADIYISPWRMSLEAKRSLRITNKPNALIFQGIKKMVFSGISKSGVRARREL